MNQERPHKSIPHVPVSAVGCAVMAVAMGLSLSAPHAILASEPVQLSMTTMKPVCRHEQPPGPQEGAGGEEPALPGSCPSADSSMPVVRTAPVLVTPNLEPVTQTRQVMKKGVAPEVLDFLRRMHVKIVEGREYPLNAVKLGLQGTTTVKINLLPDGQAESIRVRKSSGHHLLDEAALEAVHKILPLTPPPEAGNQMLEVSVPISFLLR
ncbi:MAG: energy transducer TonB [Nitrospira defluvii]|nr:energy transducer TonB [Nitrospira defluvii]